MSYAGPYSFRDLSVVSTTLTYEFSLPHLRVDHLTLHYKDSEASEFTAVSASDYALTASGNTVTAVISSTPSGWSTGDTIRLIRATPVGATGRLVDFQDGSLSSNDLDTSALQNLYIVEEIWDDRRESLSKVVGDLTKWDGESLPITNLGAPTSTNDAARKADVDAVALSTGSLPTLNPSSTRYWLVSETSGAWSSETTTSAQNILSLGSAAYANTGTDATDVPTTAEADVRYLNTAENLDDLTDVAAAQANLLLGTAAQFPAGTGASNVLLLNGSGGLPAVNASLLTNLPGTIGRIAGLLELDFTLASGFTTGALATGGYADLLLPTGVTFQSPQVTVNTSAETFTLTGLQTYIIEIYVMIKNANASDQTFNIQLYDNSTGAPEWTSPAITCKDHNGHQSFQRKYLFTVPTSSAKVFKWQAQASVGTDLTLVSGQSYITRITNSA